MKKQNTDSADAQAVKAESKPCKKSWARRLLRTLLWVCLTPIVLVLMLAVALYIPPVQKWAVNTAGEMLSESLGMIVSVEDVHLRFPLDLSMGGLRVERLQGNNCDSLAVVKDSDKDLLAAADVLHVGVRLRPLFDGNVEVDEVLLEGTTLHTADLIPACSIDGTVGTLRLEAHPVSLGEQTVSLDYALLQDADLMVVMADSVEEDTTESEPVDWKIDLKEVCLKNVCAGILLAPAADSIVASTCINEANLKAFLDLGTSTYSIEKLNIDGRSLSYSMAGMRIPLSFDAITLDTRLLVDSSSVSIDTLCLKTLDSQICMKGNMDFNAFDSIAPGLFSVEMAASVGKDDVLRGARVADGMSAEANGSEIAKMVNEYLPSEPLTLTVRSNGNMQNLYVPAFRAAVAGLGSVNASAQLCGSLVQTVIHASAKGARIDADAKADLEYETYGVHLSLKDLVANRFVKLDEVAALSADVRVKGSGFDFLSPQTRCEIEASLPSAHYGKINLSAAHLAAKLSQHHADVLFAINNKQIRTNLNLDAQMHVTKANVLSQLETKLGLDLERVDLQAMGFADERLEVSAGVKAAIGTDLDKQLWVSADIDNADVWAGLDSVQTKDYSLFASTTSKDSQLRFRAGDMTADFSAPYNIMTLADILERNVTVATKFLKMRKLDLSRLKKDLPVMDVVAKAGTNNPMRPVIESMGIGFRDFELELHTSPETGINSDGHVYALKSDSLIIDTISFRIEQDSTHLAYTSAVQTRTRASLPGFSAKAEGAISPRDLNVLLRFWDAKGRKGIELGLKGEVEDSVLRMQLYPEKPTLAFRQFSLRDGNYIMHRMGFPVEADVQMSSLSDSAHVVIAAGPTPDEGKQMLRLLIEQLNIEELTAVMPFLPRMGGLLGIDALYNDHEENFDVKAEVDMRRFSYEGISVGDLHSNLNYSPIGKNTHHVEGSFDVNGQRAVLLHGEYASGEKDYLDADIDVCDFPLSIANPFVPDQMIAFTGTIDGSLCVKGATESLRVNGGLITRQAHILSEPYSLDLSMVDDTLHFNDSRLSFNRFHIYGAGTTPLTLNGYVDFADVDDLNMSLSLYGQNFKLIEAKRSRKSLLFGDMYGDFFARVNGTPSNLSVRGLVNVLAKTNMTYIMSDATISQGDRLEDIVTFVDFNAPPDTTVVRPTAMGMDMNLSLNVEEGAKFACEFSADKQSYVNVRGGGNLTMTATPQGRFDLIGRLTVNEGEMKYTLPVIPLKTFTIARGSYIEFNGDMMNPTLNVAATERTKAAVSSSGTTARSVVFDVGLKITNTLSNMGLLFTIEAPNDAMVQEELASLTEEDKNKLAVALLATGMYISDSNTSAINGYSALNNFLQAEINNITGKALNSIVDLSVGIDQTTYASGATGTDYSFKFSKRFFSDRLSVNVGGRVSDNSKQNRSGNFNSFIDDVTLEWRLDNSGTRYVRLFHANDYENVVEGELQKNGGGIVLRKKVDKITDLFIFKRSKKQAEVKAPNTKKQ